MYEEVSTLSDVWLATLHGHDTYVMHDATTRYVAPGGRLPRSQATVECEGLRSFDAMVELQAANRANSWQIVASTTAGR